MPKKNRPSPKRPPPLPTARPAPDRSGATAMLAEAVERYRAILDTAVDGIVTINEQGLIESFNHAAERIFGYRPLEVIGRNVNVLMPEPYRAQHDGYLHRYLSTGQARIIGVGREVQGRRKDGSVFPLELAVGEVRLANRRLFTGITRDISDRKRAETDAHQRLQELAHVARLVSMGDLATGLAHEVNQPLTAIVSHAQACLRLLAADDVSTETLTESLQQIARQGQRAGNVIRRLREFLQKGKREVRPGVLNAIVNDVLGLLKSEIEARRVRIVLRLDPDLPAAPMDSVQVEQVMLNLVRNALDAMEAVGDERRVLTLATRTVRDGGTQIELSVRDAGVGLTAAVQEQLFKPFFTTKADGLGQGLSICRSIVEAHQGRIWAEPNEQGGATFAVRLPVAGSAEP